MLEYTNRKLISAGGEIGVLGLIRLKRCIVAPELNLIDVRIIVTSNVSGHQCILGRDIIKRIPALKQKFDDIHDILKE